MFAHLARDSRQHHVRAVIELDFEECIRLLIDDGAFSGNQIVSCQFCLLLIANRDNVRSCSFVNQPVSSSTASAKTSCAKYPSAERGRHATRREPRHKP